MIEPIHLLVPAIALLISILHTSAKRHNAKAEAELLANPGIKNDKKRMKDLFHGNPLILAFIAVASFFLIMGGGFVWIMHS